MKKVKKAYYHKYFYSNWNNIKNIWTRIESLLSLKTVVSSVPSAISFDDDDTIMIP